MKTALLRQGATDKEGDVIGIPWLMPLRLLGHEQKFLRRWLFRFAIQVRWLSPFALNKFSNILITPIFNGW